MDRPLKVNVQLSPLLDQLGVAFTGEPSASSVTVMESGRVLWALLSSTQTFVPVISTVGSGVGAGGAGGTSSSGGVVVGVGSFVTVMEFFPPPMVMP